jgi:hypothetical protein
MSATNKGGNNIKIKLVGLGALKHRLQLPINRLREGVRERERSSSKSDTDRE